MAKYYAILINTYGRSTPVDSIKGAVSMAKNWAKLNKDQWIVATEQSASFWREKIRTLLNPEDSILVIRIEKGERSGWLDKNVVDWLDRDHSDDRGT